MLPPFRQLITYSGAAIATLPSHFRIHERVHAALAAAMNVYGQQQRAERVWRDHPILRVCAEGPVLVRAPGDRALDCGDEKKPTSEPPVAKPESPRITLHSQAFSTALQGINIERATRRRSGEQSTAGTLGPAERARTRSDEGVRLFLRRRGDRSRWPPCARDDVNTGRPSPLASLPSL